MKARNVKIKEDMERLRSAQQSKRSQEIKRKRSQKPTISLNQNEVDGG